MLMWPSGKISLTPLEKEYSCQDLEVITWVFVYRSVCGVYVPVCTCGKKPLEHLSFASVQNIFTSKTKCIFLNQKIIKHFFLLFYFLMENIVICVDVVLQLLTLMNKYKSITFWLKSKSLEIPQILKNDFICNFPQNCHVPCPCVGMTNT